MPLNLALLSSLRIPQEFSHYEKLDDAGVIQKLQRWKSDASQVLLELKTLLNQHDENISLEDQARVVASVVPFDGEDPWVVPKARETSIGEQELVPFRCNLILAKFRYPTSFSRARCAFVETNPDARRETTFLIDTSPILEPFYGS